jgi:hypothetical protein
MRRCIQLAAILCAASIGMACRPSAQVNPSSDAHSTGTLKEQARAFERGSWSDLEHLNRYEKLRLFAGLSTTVYDDFPKAAAFAKNSFGMASQLIDRDDLCGYNRHTEFMVDRANIKASLDEWMSWYNRTLAHFTRRDHAMSVPSHMASALIGVRRCGKTYMALDLGVRSGLDVPPCFGRHS